MVGGIRFLTHTSTPWVIWQYDWIDPLRPKWALLCPVSGPFQACWICGGDGESVSCKGVYPESAEFSP